MAEDQAREKPGFFERMKHRVARGLVIAGASYIVFMVILLASNRTNVSADVLVLWMLIPVLYLSIVAALLAESSWSAAVHFSKKAPPEE